MADPPPPPAVDALLRALDLPPRALQCFDPVHPWVDAQRPLLVLAPEFGGAQGVLADRYPASHPLRAVHAAPAPGAEPVATATTLDRAPLDAAAWCLAPLPAAEDVRGLHGLRAVVARLVGPDGCPWDREQTPESLRRYLLEETYEAVEAIDRGDRDGLREELGDLLMHLLMQSALAEHRGDFRLEDVLAGITAKMVRRHPHVFGDEAVDSPDGLLSRWEELKAQERTRPGGDDPDPAGLGGVPTALPALQRAQSLLGRAKRLKQLETAGTAGAGTDPAPPTAAPLAAALPGPPEALGPRLHAALGALLDAPAAPPLGELLWLLAAWASAHDLDAEEALRRRGTSFVDAVRAAAAPGPTRDLDAR